MICYIYKQELNFTNSSTEHIIPNALGGSLKSKNLLCKKCNEVYGGKYDSALSNQLNPIASLLNIKRDRGEPQSFDVQDMQENK